RRDLVGAWQLAEEALSATGPRRPLFEFLTLLDQAAILSARGEVHEAIATVGWAREALSQPGPALLARADELEAELRLSLGDVRTATELAAHLPRAPRELLLARVALAVGDHQVAERRLQDLTELDLAPRRSLVRLLLLAAAAIERGDRKADSVLAVALEAA